MLVDVYANRRMLAPQYEVQSFFGRLENIVVVHFSATAQLALDAEATVILAGIRQCEINATNSMETSFYSRKGRFEVVDITCVQCLIGRIQNGQRWAIIDRSDRLQQSQYAIEE
jgi:hypothetical protein